jgi:hypothetical protein
VAKNYEGQFIVLGGSTLINMAQVSHIERIQRPDKGISFLLYFVGKDRAERIEEESEKGQDLIKELARLQPGLSFGKLTEKE